MHNVEGTVEDTKLIVTIDLAAITRDGHSRLSTDCAGLAKNDPRRQCQHLVEADARQKGDKMKDTWLVLACVGWSFLWSAST